MEIKNDKICFSRTLAYLAALVVVVLGTVVVTNKVNEQKISQESQAGERNTLNHNKCKSKANDVSAFCAKNGACGQYARPISWLSNYDCDTNILKVGRCCTPNISRAWFPTSTPKPTPTQIISPTPDNNIFQQLIKYEKFMRNNSITDMDNRVLIKQSSRANNEILSSNLQNQLHSMLSEYFANPQLKDYVFKVNNDEIKYTENWNISGTKGTTYYAYYFKNCNPTSNPTICFDPNDNRCLKKCDYYGLLSIQVKKNYQYNDNALYEWSIGGWKIPPDEDKFPWIFGVDKNDQVYTMASRTPSRVMVEETTTLGNNKVFIGYSTRAGYLLIEIYRENNNIVLRGIYLRG